MRYSTVCPLPAGSAVFRDERTWHGACPRPSVPRSRLYDCVVHASLIMSRGDCEVHAWLRTLRSTCAPPSHRCLPA